MSLVFWVYFKRVRCVEEELIEERIDEDGGDDDDDDKKHDHDHHQQHPCHEESACRVAASSALSTEHPRHQRTLMSSTLSLERTRTVSLSSQTDTPLSPSVAGLMIFYSSHLLSTLFVNRHEQDAQLSQRDRAAGYISFGQKWKTGTGRQYFTDIIGLSSTTVI